MDSCCFYTFLNKFEKTYQRIKSFEMVNIILFRYTQKAGKLNNC